jgi:hypothetical protein
MPWGRGLKDFRYVSTRQPLAMSQPITFRHQNYTPGGPTSPVLWRKAERFRPDGSAEFRDRMAQVAAALRSKQIARVILIHGTFSGDDTLGLAAGIETWSKALGGVYRLVRKNLFDLIVRERGNYTRSYTRLLAKALASGPTAPIAVERFIWSGENNHIGRAHAAVKLIDHLSKAPDKKAGDGPKFASAAEQNGTVPFAEAFSSDARTTPAANDGVTLCLGHSHGGNVLALVTQLLAAGPDKVAAFFDAAEPYWCDPSNGQVDLDVWPRVRDRLLAGDGAALAQRLDVVSLGSPILYGWDLAGCRRLLHIMSHRPNAEAPDEHHARFVPRWGDVLFATGGDLIAQLGIAGTNLPVPWGLSRTRDANLRLSKLLAANVEPAKQWERWKVGSRVHDTSTTVLADFGPLWGIGINHAFGHAVYTQRQWMLWLFEEIARQL